MPGTLLKVLMEIGRGKAMPSGSMQVRAYMQPLGTEVSYGSGSGLGTLRSLMAEKPRLLRADREVWNSREDYATAIYENVGYGIVP